MTVNAQTPPAQIPQDKPKAILPTEPVEPESMARARALITKMGFDPEAREAPDPAAVVDAVRAHMPEVADLLVFSLEEHAALGVDRFTATHVIGLAVMLEEFCDALKKIAARRAVAEAPAKRAPARGGARGK